ncbi:hybrid sensor histidine kinase/response regulator transcription factor [Algibacter mikhailovii]|uniref:hybrid sensor histidine kinase/response regulator transcription factor n=1 Tax=Algibacter mikhailovii TaxID=425498 RepID=UPI00249472D1|nr:two-component regulator propeller domain-containing protein [Algibacter mikhailovii]
MTRLLIFVLCFLFYINCFAQNKTYVFNHLNSVDGLSQSAVIAIHQDQLGRIWLGTRDGLNKYDGTNFRVYRTEEDNPKSISNNDILSIYEDNDGYLWIGTYNGLNKYNPKTDGFTRYFHSEESNSLCNNTIWTIETLSNGEIWIGTSKGLSIYNKAGDNFTNYLNTFKRPVLGQVLSVLETSGGQVLIGTGAGIYKVNRSNERLDFSILKGSEALFVQDLVEGPQNHILVATKNLGVLSYNFILKHFSLYLEKEAEEVNENNVRQLLFDNKGVLWVGTYGGLKIVNKDKSVTKLKADILNTEGLSKNSVKSLYKDKKGSIWIGTYYGGVNIWDETNVNFRGITQSLRGNGLNYSVVSSIARYNDNILFGTEGGGVNIWNRKENTFSYLDDQSSRLSGNNIKALKVLDELLYIGTFKNGIEVYNLSKKRFEYEEFPKSLLDIISNIGVYAIEKDNLNNLWIGTFGQGVIKYNSESRNFTRIQNVEDRDEGLSSNLIRIIRIDSKNNVWVGTEKGLNKITESNGIETYFYDAKVQYGEDVLCVFEDSNKTLWVGTKSKGLFKYNGKTFEFVSLPLGEERVSAVHSILEEEDEGQLWLSTNLGLIKYTKFNQEVQLFNQTDGLLSNEFNDNASLKIGKSEFFFGGPSGVTHFNSNTITTNNYVPQVILTDFNVKEYENYNPKDVLKKTLPYTESINLSHKQGNFSISFSIPNFINSSNNKYKYRLKGLEKKWNVTSSNTASYTIQNPGDYVFEVKGANNDSIWTQNVTQLKINVEPAPWRTWWAFAIYGLLILGALYFLITILRSRATLRHDLQLESMETERTKELNRLKLEFFTNISHEFRTPLALILGPLQQVIEDYSGSNKIFKKLLVIENSANHLLQLINRLMDFRKLENNLYKLETAEGNIIKFLHEIYLSFSEFAKDGNYDYQFLPVSDEILVYYDRTKLERVFYNLISNAFRYTPKGGKILVKVKKNEDHVTICIEDTGVGIAEEYRSIIFERFFEVALNNKPDKDYNKGTGIGLSIAKNIVDLHKGNITVTNSTESSGSIFSVKLPLGRKHLSDQEIIKDFKFSEDLSQYVSQLEPGEKSIEEELPDPINSEKGTVLLVEDNKPLRKFMKSVLDTQYNVLEAENGEIGLKMAKKEFPDLIVSDVVMPVMTGTELCAEIKNNVKTSHIPLILLTSRTSLVYKLEGLERGADDYISKPFDVNEFKVRIKNLLNATARLKEKFAENDLLNPNQVAINSVDQVLYKKAIQIVEAQIGNEDFDVPFFAAELGVSRTMLFTKIKAWSNFTPNEFVLHFRMTRAAQLLEQGKINISEVSYKVGFKNPKYFSKSFQKKFGISPSQYSKKFSES